MELALVWIAAGAVSFGAILLMWGRLLHRAIVILIGSGTGLLLGGIVVARLNVDARLVYFALAAVGGLAGLVGARIFWALLAGCVFAVVPAAILLGEFLLLGGGASTKVLDAIKDAQDLPAWLEAIGSAGFLCLKHFADKNPTALLVVGVPFVIAILIAMLRPRLGAIFMTALLGGLALTAGAAIVTVKIRPSLWPTGWRYWQVPVAAAGFAALVGLIFQYRGAIRSDRKHKREGAEPPDKGESKDTGSAE